MLVLELFEGEIPSSDDLNASVKANLKTEQVLNPLELTKDKIEDRENSDNKTDTKEFAEFGNSSMAIERLQLILRKANPDYQGQGKFHQENGKITVGEFPNCGIRDLSPLKGLQLQGLDLSGNPVRELRHLKGMPLRTLFLENTRVESLRDLSDANLVELRLNHSPIQSLKGLDGQPIGKSLRRRHAYNRSISAAIFKFTSTLAL